MKLKLWGTRGSIPVGGPAYIRHGGATTCLEITLNTYDPETPERVMIDFGSGAVELGRNRFDLGRCVALQSHLHWDHIQGFPFFSALFNPKNLIDFYAVSRDGQSLEAVLREQMTVPTFPITLDVVPAALVFHEVQNAAAFHLGELELRAAEMCHPSGSSAWRLDHRGVSLVFSGDCEVQQGGKDALIELAQGAQVLVMDAQYFPDEYAAKQGWGHSTPIDAVQVALEAGVGRLILTHHDPAHDDRRLDEKLAIARQHAGRDLLVDNGFDGMEVEIATQRQRLAV